MKARLTKTRIIRSPLAIMGALVLTVGGLALGTAASGADEAAACRSRH